MVPVGMPPMRARAPHTLAPVLGALALALAMALGAGAPAAGAAEPEAVRALADRAAAHWIGRQLPDGRFIDPITRRTPRNYGVTMLGYALLRAGGRSGDRAQLKAARLALDAAVRSPSSQRGAFHLLGLAAAYNYARLELAGDPGFRRSLPRWARQLRRYGQPAVGPGARACVRNPRCFHNLQLVDAAASVELLATGLRSSRPGTKLSDRGGLRRRALSVLADSVSGAIGRRGRSSGPGPRRGLGIISDPPSHPLAYHALSASMLAHTASKLGPGLPPRSRAVLRRAAETLAAYTAPDGDIAYIGRSQRQSFAPAVAAYVGETAARLLPGNAAEAARYRGLSERALARLRSHHLRPGGGLSIVPRRLTRRSGYRGLDGYASMVTYEGLTLFALNLAADQAWRSRASGASAATGPLTADADGHFVDPEKTRFAAVRRGDVWFAVHSRQVRRDLRLDFGLVALKRALPGGRWEEVLRPRPLTLRRVESAGPVLMRGRDRGYPYGRRISVRPDGAVAVRGGFRTSDGRWLRQGVRFRFEPIEGGVRVVFRGRRGDRFRFLTFLPAREARRGGGGAAGDRTAIASTSPRPARLSFHRAGFASCCDARLVAARAVVKLGSSRRVVYTIRSRTPRAQPQEQGGGIPVAAALTLGLGAPAALALGLLLATGRGAARRRARLRQALATTPRRH